MKRAIIVGCVGVAGAWAWWLTRSDDGGARPVESAATSRPRGQDRVAPPPTDRTAAPATTTDRPPGAASPELVLQLDEIAVRLKGVARPCVARRPAPPAREPDVPDESLDRIRVRAHVVMRDGVAMVEQVEHVADGFADAALETCVLDALRAARWATTAADGAIGVEHTLYVGDLLGVDPLDPPRDVVAAPPPAGVPLPTNPPPLLPPPA